MTVLNLQVAAGADDGYWGTFGYANNAGLYVSTFGGGPTHSWGRVTNATVPNAATISSAIATLKRYSADTGTIDYKVDCYAEDNATAPTSGADAIGRTHTTANTTGSVSGGAGEADWAVDITSAVQEVVNRAGWASGNAIVVTWIHGGVNAFTQVVAYSYELDTAKTPKLDITYSSGGGSHSPGAGRIPMAIMVR